MKIKPRVMFGFQLYFHLSRLSKNIKNQFHAAKPNLFFKVLSKTYLTNTNLKKKSK